ncbi:hypothetical protein KPB2_5342 [Klebsiella pneumoniae Kb677]|nr:hypothetical protein KPB2_5342 [Klebsiella pneumoniae Kb677]
MVAPYVAPSLTCPAVTALHRPLASPVSRVVTSRPPTPVSVMGLVTLSGPSVVGLSVKRPSSEDRPVIEATSSRLTETCV